MKKIITVITPLLLAAHIAFAQTAETEDPEVYPVQYTFEKADSFARAGAYEKAVWFYINLYPGNKPKVVKLVKTLAAKLDTFDMGTLIGRSFLMYGTFDPVIMSFDNGMPVMEMDKLKVKGAWADELMQEAAESDKPLATASAYNIRGLEKARAGQVKEAINDFDKAIALEPSGQLYFNRAYTKSKAGDFAGAIPDYDRAIGFKYRLAEAYFERGYCKDRLNNAGGAIDDYTSAIAEKKGYADAYNNRAFVKMKQKDFNGAIKDFDEAIGIQPDFAAAYVNRGFARKELGNKTGACDDWNKAAAFGYKQAEDFLRDYCE